MNIFILGDGGYLGSYLKQEFKEYLGSGPYDYVINCAGMVSVEKAEEDPEKSYASNVQTVLSLIKEYPKSRLIQFSSYYVYDKENTACDEFENTTDRYFYMKHKLTSEKYALTVGGVCFRLGKLYGHPEVSKQGRLTEYVINSTEEITLDNVEFNPTSLMTVKDVLEHEFKHRDLNGLFNLSDDGQATHYLYGQHILKALNKKNKIKHIDKLNKVFHNYGKFKMNIDKIKGFLPITTWETRTNDYLRSIYA